MDPKVERLFEALDDLIRPAVEGRKSSDVDQVLERNLNSALARLEIKDLNSLGTLKQINCYTLPKCSIRWRFVCALLHILVSLKKTLCSNSIYVPASVIPAPTNSPSISTSSNSSTSSSSSSCASSTSSSTSTSTTTSTSSQEPTSHSQFILPQGRDKTLRACLQFVVSIGLLPNLLPGVGVSLASRCSAASTSLARDDKLLDLEKHERLSAVTRGLMIMCDQPILRNLIISNHLGDVLAALAQLSFVPFKRPTIPPGEEDMTATTADDFIMTPGILAQLEKERAKFKSYFISLVSVTYQPLIIRELMLLQGQPVGGNKGQRAHPAPKWLKRPCTHMLMQCMCRPNGIESLIRVILDAAPDTVNQPAKIDIIVQLVSTPPLASSAETNNYLESVATQIVDLIRRGDPIMTRIAVLCIEALLESRHEFCTRRILKVLLQPLLSCTTANNINVYEFEAMFLPELFTSESGCTPLPTPTDLAQCIRALHNAWVSDNSHTAVLNGQLLRPALMVLFRLGCTLAETHSPLREPVHDLVYKHLQHCSKEELPSVYSALLFREPLDGSIDLIPEITFVLDEATGEIQIKENYEKIQNETTDWLIWSQTAGDTLVSILLQRDPTGELVNILFVCLLSKTTLHQENKYTIVGAKLLTVLTAIPYVQECITNDPLPVIKFIKTWLEREANLMAASKEAEFQDWECLITVLMILTVIINYSGGDSNSQPAETDWEAFKVLLDPLQKIQKLATSEEIKTFAADVYNTLVSHGTIRKEPAPLVSEIYSTNPPSSASTTSLPPTSTTAAPTQAPTTKGRRKKAKPKKKDEKANAAAAEANATETKQTKEKKTNENNNKKKNDVQQAASLLELHNADLNKLLESSAAAAAASGKTGGNAQNVVSSNVLEAMIHADCVEIPIRGGGLIALTRLLNHMDSSVKPYLKRILTIMHEGIRHPDPWVYLAAFRGIVALSAFEKEQVVMILIKEYNNSTPRTDMPETVAVEHRLKIGEVLVLLMRMHGETLVKYKHLLIDAFLRGTKDLAHQIRVSSLSNLAEVCKEMRYSVGSVINEIMICISSILRSDPEIEVRRAAVMVFTNMLRGLGKDMHKVLSDQMPQIYAILKHVYQDDADEKLRLHAQLALEEVDDFAFNFMFPKPSLDKHIFVRSAPSDF